MIEIIGGALLIMLMRVADVTLGTFRTIMVIQAKKYVAAIIGFAEVLIWIFAMRYIVEHMDDTINLVAYAAGFALGNILGIYLEEKVAFGYAQVNIISRFRADDIADSLRKSRFGVTILPGEGGTGGIEILVTIIRRKDLKSVMKMVNSIDENAFVTIQHSRPYRGFIHASRK